MADISNLKISSEIYTIKDKTARQTATDADTKSDVAIQDSGEAKTLATTANNNALEANTKIDNSKLIGNYTDATETLEVLLEIGSV